MSHTKDSSWALSMHLVLKRAINLAVVHTLEQKQVLLMTEVFLEAF